MVESRVTMPYGYQCSGRSRRGLVRIFAVYAARLYLQERAPDGSARGPVSPFSIRQANGEQAAVAAVPSPDGSRVLLVYADDGIHTLPIACAD